MTLRDELAADISAAIVEGTPELASLLRDLLDPPTWKEQAACRGRDDVTWFPGRGQSTAPAKAVCDQCPVKRHCLDYALDLEDRPDGIWAATSKEQRGKVARTRVAAVALGERFCDWCETAFMPRSQSVRFCTSACGRHAGRGVTRAQWEADQEARQRRSVGRGSGPVDVDLGAYGVDQAMTIDDVRRARAG